MIQTSNQDECHDPIYDMTSPQTKKVKYEDNIEGCTLRAMQRLGKVKEGSKKRSFVGKLQIFVYLVVYSFLLKNLGGES